MKCLSYTIGDPSRTAVKDRKICDAFYLLWDLRAEPEEKDRLFMEDVLRIAAKMGELNTVPEEALCCIEIVITNESQWKSDGMEKLVYDMIIWMKSKCGFGCIYVGICDSVGGAPALEALLDFSKIIEDHNLHSALLLSELRVLRVVSINMQELLGHDPSREPDAVSNVYQAEYVLSSSSAVSNLKTSLPSSEGGDIKSPSAEDVGLSTKNDNSTLSEWAESIGLEHTKIIRDENGQRGSKVAMMKNNSTNSLSSLFIILFIALIAYLFKSNNLDFKSLGVFSKMFHS